ncbi:hypothetical protein H5410_032816 [Solanum commersonii]|uniref:Uncharacterized protein n=1 Tax=Solanum commersonii TaxID=4109 RepID=A0A9J5YRC3_SOLCO|nr:hypothetical protein H5410_032816 [Solanum commersonii]
MQGVWKNLKKVRREMKHLNQIEYMRVSDKVNNLRKELMDKQSHMRTVHIPQCIIKSRKSQNQITMLTKEDGTIIKDPEKITKEAVRFYQNLLGKANPLMSATQPVVLTDGPVLSRAQQLELI